jgi:hypothetical protein
MAQDLTLLGIVAAADADGMRAALGALPGPPVVALRAGGIAALAQPAGKAPRKALLLARDRRGLLAGLLALQRRLEAACQLGPFLPADPGAPPVPAAELPALLEAGATVLAQALAARGRRHQWDVVLRWQADAVLGPVRDTLQGLSRIDLAAGVQAALAAARDARRAALRQALRPAVLDIADAEPGAEETACGATVLVEAGGEAAIEAALATLPAALQPGLAVDMRGPLPPIAFGALRVARLPEGALDRAWATLRLPEEMAPGELPRRWREVAAALHPDRIGTATDTAGFAEAREAYRLIERLAAPGAPLSRRALARNRCHLLLEAA